jgi:hypothetical protein
MPAERLSMRKVREVLRLNFQGHSVRQITRSLGMPRTTVRDYLHRAEAAGLAWPIPDHLDDQAIEDRLFVKPEDQQSSRPFPDWAYIHAEMRRKHMTLLLLWQEYKGQHPEDGYESGPRPSGSGCARSTSAGISSSSISPVTASPGPIP